VKKENCRARTGSFFNASINLISYKAFIMIQRVQSIWLFLAAACAFAGFKFSFYTGNQPGDTLLHELNAASTLPIMVTTIAIGVLALITIFLFKNRSLQTKLCILGIVLEAVLVFLYYRETSNFTKGTYSLTALLHVIILLAFILAARGIGKDSKLLKESNRLR
jgi:peptidoglycan/LPS O-acetylase OafA/YrhL